jgi:hypothetical protein
MPANQIIFSELLKIAFSHINESPRTLAEFYIDRDRTLVYKWLNNSATPPKKLVPGIVRFIKDHTIPSARVVIRSDFNRYIEASGIHQEAIALLTSTADFEEYLEEIFSYAISEKKQASTKGSEKNENREADGGLTVSVKLVLAVLAATLGGLLWNVLNRIAGWPFYMGGSANEPLGTASAIWGFLTLMPVILLVLSISENRLAFSALLNKRNVFLSILYAAAGALGAFVFYNAGIRGAIEKKQIGYFPQELAIAFFFALIIATLPFLTLLLFRQQNKRSWQTLLFVLLPCVACSAIVLLTALIGKPDLEISQLRGFLVGGVLRSVMFFQADWALKKS